MPKKTGPNRDKEKCIDVMNELLKSLGDFSKCPLKRCLKGREDMEAMTKMVNEALKEATNLALGIEDLRDAVKSGKAPRNSRFASQRVIAKFLERS